jgi:hypothetical protein
VGGEDEREGCEVLLGVHRSLILTALAVERQCQKLPPAQHRAPAR